MYSKDFLADQTTSNGGPSLVVLLPLARHSVDEAVSARVHVPDSPRDGKDCQSNGNHCPKDDVEDDWIHVGELWRQIQRLQSETAHIHQHNSIV